MTTYFGTGNSRMGGFIAARIITGAVVLAVGLMTAGCAAMAVRTAARAGKAGVARVKGELQVRLKADPRAVEKAAVKAFEVLDIRKISSHGTAVEAEVIGRTATDAKVTLKAQTEAADPGYVFMRIDTFADESMSRRICDEVQAQLPAATRALAQDPEDK